eukprot:TRINITY_DN2448_c0_g1_i1.p1 TRINITY_DN2448_c0_g1~~TRINITY_DN2448_c0_g1_i1.p1  ORF type:complete len:126 (-),score=11.76 TRINITY_DN2448_c0_g1_i1:70-447(-)
MGDLTANSGSLTIAGVATSFTSTGNILAGLNLNLPSCQVLLQGNIDQSVRANVGKTSGVLEAPSQIIKTNNGQLVLDGHNVNLHGDVRVAHSGLSIMGQVDAKGRLIASETIDIDEGKNSVRYRG